MSITYLDGKSFEITSPRTCSPAAGGEKSLEKFDQWLNAVSANAAPLVFEVRRARKPKDSATGSGWLPG
jgi:hypothetical protein